MGIFVKDKKYVIEFWWWTQLHNEEVEAVSGKEAQNKIKEKYPNCHIFLVQRLLACLDTPE